MEQELKSSIIINLAGNVARRSRQFGKSLTGFRRIAKSNLSAVRRETVGLGRQVKKLGNRYTSFFTGAALLGAGKSVVDLERRFTRLGIQANKPADEMERLKQLTFDTAKNPEIRVDASQITSAIEEIVEKTGDLDFALDNIRNIGLAIQATGGEGESIGGILAEFQKQGIKAPKEVLETLDALNVQGKEGAFTLQNLARLGPRVVTAYTSMGRSGKQAMIEMGAALQVAMQGTGEAAVAATSFEALLRTLGNNEKVKLLESVGIQVFDLEKLEQGEKVMRPINELMVEITEGAKGMKTNFSQIFESESMRAFNAIGTEFLSQGKVTSIEKFMQVQADGTATIKDSKRAAQDAQATIDSTQNSIQQTLDEYLSTPVDTAADVVNNISGTPSGEKINVNDLTTEFTLRTLSNLGIEEATRELNRFHEFSDNRQRRDKITEAPRTGKIRRQNIGTDKHKGTDNNNKLEGQIDIKIQSERPVKVTKLKSNQRDVDINVDTGMALQGGGAR